MMNADDRSCTEPCRSPALSCVDGLSLKPVLLPQLFAVTHGNCGGQEDNDVEVR